MRQFPRPEAAAQATPSAMPGRARHGRPLGHARAIRAHAAPRRRLGAAFDELAARHGPLLLGLTLALLFVAHRVMTA